jgi:hypothetical protein
MSREAEVIDATEKISPTNFSSTKVDKKLEFMYAVSATGTENKNPIAYVIFLFLSIYFLHA